MHRSIFEALMMVCFSVSWIFSIIRSLRSRSTGGKSILFLWIVFAGYFSGILHKVFNSLDWVIVLYSFNLAMIFADILLYYRNFLYERELRLNSE